MLPASSSWPLARVFTGWKGLEDGAERQARRLRPLREELTRVPSRDAFYRQGPFVGSSGAAKTRCPGPATGSPLLAMDQPLSGTLAPPWVFVRTFPSCLSSMLMWRLRPESPTYLSLAEPVDGFTHRRSLRARSPFTRPCRSFCCANAELIRDQTPPDDFCNCNIDVRATKPGLQLLAGTMASTTFLFFSHHAPHC